MIHHITAISKSPQIIKDFYTKILGLRLVKVTINQDDLSTYHLYFGDKLGRPGTVLTFFPWSHLEKGWLGNGLVEEVYFSAPKESFDFWEKRLKQYKLKFQKEMLFREKTLFFQDPCGLGLRILFNGKSGDWSSGDIPLNFSIRGFAGAKLSVRKQDLTGKIIHDFFDYSFLEKENNFFRYKSNQDFIDVVEDSSKTDGKMGSGSVHHIAFRCKNLEQQKELREKLLVQGLNPSNIIDRYYFSSVYFVEPSSILFEIATDGPGFHVDESVEELGSKLVLPPKFEKYRKEIQENLPKLKF